MKKKLLIGLIATVLLMAVAIFIFFFKKADNNILFKIPGQSKSVLIIDVPAIAKKLFIDEFSKKNNSTRQLAKAIPDSLAAINWNQSGLNLFDKMVLFSLEDSGSISLHFIIKINDLKKYNLFIDKLGNDFKFKTETQNKIKFAYWKSLGILIAWNNEYVSGTRTSENTIKSKNILEKILSTRKEQSIMTNKVFAQKLVKTHDVMFYSNSYKQNPYKQLNVLNSSLENFVLYIDFNQGKTEINIETFAKKGSPINNLFAKKNNDLNLIKNSDTTALNLYLNVNAEVFSQIFNQYSGIQFKEKDIPLIKAWNGELNLVLDGIKTIENEYISYDFDDNFNKIEIKKKKKDKVLNLKAVASYDQNRFDSIFKFNKPDKDGKDTLLYKGSNYLLKRGNNSFLIYNKLLRKPVLEKKNPNCNISLEADCQKLIKIIEEFGIKTDTKWFKNIPISNIDLNLSNKEEIKLKVNFYFIDKNKNSLFSLVEYFGKK